MGQVWIVMGHPQDESALGVAIEAVFATEESALEYLRQLPYRFDRTYEIEDWEVRKEA